MKTQTNGWTYVHARFPQLANGVYKLVSSPSCLPASRLGSITLGIITVYLASPLPPPTARHLYSLPAPPSLSPSTIHAISPLPYPSLPSFPSALSPPLLSIISPTSSLHYLLHYLFFTFLSLYTLPYTPISTLVSLFLHSLSTTILQFPYLLMFFLTLIFSRYHFSITLYLLFLLLHPLHYLHLPSTTIYTLHILLFILHLHSFLFILIASSPFLNSSFSLLHPILFILLYSSRFLIHPSPMFLLSPSRPSPPNPPSTSHSLHRPAF